MFKYLWLKLNIQCSLFKVNLWVAEVEYSMFFVQSWFELPDYVFGMSMNDPWMPDHVFGNGWTTMNARPCLWRWTSIKCKVKCWITVARQCLWLAYGHVPWLWWTMNVCSKCWVARPCLWLWTITKCWARQCLWLMDVHVNVECWIQLLPDNVFGDERSCKWLK